MMQTNLFSRPAIAGGMLCILVGAVTMLLSSHFPWLVKWPAELTLPLNVWVETVVGAVLEALKPLARSLSWLLGFAMVGVNWLLTATPWITIFGVFVAVAWYAGGLSMSLLTVAGLLFVLLSGYWVEGMNTLALVTVSVPLALLTGLLIGVFANEYPRFKGMVQSVLDVMQTIPTFAYLTPLLFLFGFGPVVGLIASAIYAAPPMARNVLLGLERIEPEIREAAIMSGATRIQQLLQVEIPAAKRQIMVGVNQCLMAALSMVIIAAVIGGFNDIGWEVLLTMRKAQFGQSLLAGLVIVAFAILIDRISIAFSRERVNHDVRVSYVIAGLAIVFGFALNSIIGGSGDFNYLNPAAQFVDETLSAFTAANGAALDGVKNNAMFFGLLPLRIGLDDAVLPFTWGFQWTGMTSTIIFSVALLSGGLLYFRGRPGLGLLVVLMVGVIETGITQLPWLFVLTSVGVVGYLSGGKRLAVLVVGLLAIILLSGLWERALYSVYLCLAAVITCMFFGGLIGLACALSPTVWRIVRPICDMLQTIPLFVFLIPVLMFFQIGEFSAFIAIIAYAIVPMIRYTHHGLTTTPADLLEAATASGATASQIVKDVRFPYAVPTILLGVNQTVLYAFAMLVIAALIGTTGLGQSIFLALGQADIGLGITAGAAMAILAFIADRLIQGFAEENRKALGI